jgi:hypothetical protein
MNVAICEARKVEAMDAWRRGDLVEASAAWSELTTEYERHHFADGLLALRFNHLLVALEAGDRPRVDALMASLGSQFLQIGDPSPLAADVAMRICRLFAEPVAGVDHQATTALVALAADRIGGQPEPLRPVGSDEGPLPQVSVLEELFAEDAALLLLDRAGRRPGAEDPTWLDAVRRAFGPPALMTPTVSRAMEEAARDVAANNLLHGYPLLVDALEWAVQHDGALAAEWALGLADLAAAGLPDRLNYVPSMPEDRRLRATLTLHTRLAQALAGEAGAEGLARRQWAKVISLGREWLAMTRARAARGGGRSEDVGREAEVALQVAQALCTTCDLAGAEEVLAPSLARAKRDAFDDRSLSGRLLAAQADLLERRGAPAEAAWLAMVDATLPGVESSVGIRRLARVVDGILADGVVDRARMGVLGLAGLARTGSGEAASTRLGRARALLAMLRPALTPTEAAEAALVVDLTAARLGDRAAAERALEAAHIVGDHAALALAALHRGWQAWEEAMEPGERVAALTLLTEASAEARHTAAGALRRAVDAAVAAAHRTGLPGTDPSLVAVHLRRAVEAAEGSALDDGAGRFDHLLPADPALRLDDVVERLVAEGDAALARRLCAAGRRRNRDFSSRVGQLALAVREHHALTFRAVWLGEGDAPPALTLSGSGEGTGERSEGSRPTWPALRLGPNDVQVEFRVFEDVTFLFATTGQGIRAHRIERGERAWATDVDALRDASRDSGTRLEAVGTAVHNRLLGPVADRVSLARRLVLVPDGSLVDLPFELLRTEAGALGELLEIVVACPTAPPAFQGPPAPPEARIIGDDATARDLRISTLSGQGFFSAVEVRHGADLADQGLAAAVDRARVVHILGRIEGDGIELSADGPATALTDLGDALARGGAVCATLMGPVDGEAGHRAIAAVLPGVRGAVLVRRWDTEEDGSFLLHFLAGAAHATDTWSLAEALAAARRAAIRAHLPPAVWAAYTLFAPEAS